MKEKMKSILFVLALALVFVGATKVTMASAATATDDGSSYPKIVYSEEYVDVKAASGSVYYQILKKGDDNQTVKEANWIAAADSGDEIGNAKIFRIDFSGLSNTKDVYIGYAESNTSKTAKVIKIPAKYKSVKATLKYDTETVSGGIYGVIAKLDLKGVASADNLDTQSDALKSKALNQIVKLGWKRGANGNWKADGAFNTVEWNMLKASNGTIYLRVEGADKDGNGTMAEFRYSKEAKIKVPKTAKAPTVKIDYKKQTVALKSGMEFKLDNQTKWIQIAVKKNGSTNTTDPFAETISKAVSSVKLEQLMDKLSVASGSTFTIHVRTAATASKFASQVQDVKIVAPAAAPTVKEGAAANVMTYTAAVAASGSTRAVAPKLILDLSKATVQTLDSSYEYALVGKDYDPAAVKFTKVPSGTIDLSSKIKSSLEATLKYTDKTGNKNATVRYLEAKIIIRKAAVTEKGKEAFASQILEITPVIAK